MRGGGPCWIFAAALQFMRFAKLDLIADYPHLTRWDAAYRQRASAKAVLKF